MVHSLVELLRQNGIAIQSAYLFGSYTCGRETPDSDIDVALISNQFTGLRYDDIGPLAPFIRQIDNRLEVHTFSLSDVESSFFLQEIMQTGEKIA